MCMQCGGGVWLTGQRTTVKLILSFHLYRVVQYIPLSAVSSHPPQGFLNSDTASLQIQKINRKVQSVTVNMGPSARDAACPSCGSPSWHLLRVEYIFGIFNVTSIKRRGEIRLLNSPVFMSLSGGMYWLGQYDYVSCKEETAIKNMF